MVCRLISKRFQVGILDRPSTRYRASAPDDAKESEISADDSKGRSSPPALTAGRRLVALAPPRRQPTRRRCPLRPPRPPRPPPAGRHRRSSVSPCSRTRRWSRGRPPRPRRAPCLLYTSDAADEEDSV